MSEPEKPFFYGSAESRISPKGQVAMPKRFRAVIPESEQAQGFVLLQGEADCLYMYTHRQFGEIRQRVRAIAQRDGDPEFFRRFLEGVVAVDLDNQGRFVLPQTFRDTAGLAGADLIFIGVDDRIELWSPDKRNRAMQDEQTYAVRRQAAGREIFGI